MKTFTGQKKLIAGSAIQLLLNYCPENLFGTGLRLSVATGEAAL
jgi:hypothetical protein